MTYMLGFGIYDEGHKTSDPQNLNTYLENGSITPHANRTPPQNSPTECLKREGPFQAYAPSHPNHITVLQTLLFEKSGF